MTSKNEEAIFVRMSIGERVRWLMEHREMSQTDLALKVGVGQAAISNIVTNSSRKPSAPTLLKMAEVLRCNPGWIITGEGDPFSWSAVTSDSQVELLNLFKGMPEEAKAALLSMARQMPKKPTR